MLMIQLPSTRNWDSKSRPLGHKSPSVPTRPGLFLSYFALTMGEGKEYFVTDCRLSNSLLSSVVYHVIN